MEEIILVTGCHRTKSWFNVAFLERHADAQGSFRMKEKYDPAVRVKRQFSAWSAQGAVCNWSPEEEVCRITRNELCDNVDMIILRIRISYKIDVFLSGGSVLFVSSGYCPSNLEGQQGPIRAWVGIMMMTSTPRNSFRCLLLQR